MKILYDHQAFDMQTHGGVSRCFVELYKHRPASMEATFGVRETDNVYLKTLGFPSSGYVYNHFISSRNFLTKRFFYKAYENIRAGHPSQWDHRPKLNQYYSERLLREGCFDVFHPTFFDPYFFDYIKDKPFVVTVHDMIPELYPAYYEADDEQIVWKRELVSKATHVIAVSEQTKNDVVRLLHVPAEKISVVYHGASDVPYVPSAKSEPNYLLYVGERHYYKNFSAFIRECLPVLRRHSDLRVICTGCPFTEEENRFFHDEGVEGRFVHRFVDTDQELMDLYHHALAFVYPSSYEGFGLPILEAYKADCPVMLNKASCFPEIAGDAAMYFTIGDGPSDLEEQLEAVYGMKEEEREALLERQRLRLRRYSWRRAAEQLAAVYEKCL